MAHATPDGRLCRTGIFICQRLGGTREQAIEELEENYGLTEGQAKEKIKTYWKE